MDRFVLADEPDRGGMGEAGQVVDWESAPRFVADAMLGRLARWLRILGYDTLYDPRGHDDELVRMARAEGRILLTRDTGLVCRRGVRSLLVSHDHVEAQLRQVSAELGLRAPNRFSRCPVCNERLEAVPKSWAWGYVPPYTFCTQQEFRLCPACNRFYWRGTHWERMCSTIGKEVRTGE
ncbi:MAG: Mut7-C RNAse domain-containing protein [Anaerolineae bacterium]|nr:Mut7-C RNAse domain-containing protein [Anaerolineae bacterium]